jgi:predicted SnoaL-like aldol condensation-catalyzing enzyme
MSAEETKSVVRRYIEEVWNKQNLEAVDEFLAENYLDHSLPPESSGRAGVKAWVKAVSAVFDEQTIIEDQVKIVEHWALIDGDSLERELRAAN